ncbi:MAG: glycosyltransferase family 87 protein [Beijerinckiaceae bacterium]
MRLLSNPLVHKAVAIFGLIAFGVQIIRFHMRAGLPKPWPVTDFDAFYLAGQRALNGEYEKTYSFASYKPFYQAFTGADTYATWTYPPQFGLIVAPLASIDFTVSYILFTIVTLGAYLLVIRKLAGPAAGAVITLVFPAAVLNLLTGQNGFLTAALIGASSLLLIGNSAAAGVTLGLMTIKPHIAATLGLYCIVARRWAVVATAIATVLATSVLATFYFGVGVWGAFLEGARETSMFLASAAHPLHRMPSFYALLRTTGFSANASFIGQVFVSLLAMGLVALIAIRQWPTRQALGMTVLLGLFISPYVYDYDLPILGVAIALLLPELETRASALEQAGVMMLAWTAAFWGFGLQRAQQYMGAPANAEIAGPSLGGLFLLLLAALMWRIVRREHSKAPLKPAAI